MGQVLYFPLSLVSPYPLLPLYKNYSYIIKYMYLEGIPVKSYNNVLLDLRLLFPSQVLTLPMDFLVNFSAVRTPLSF